MLTVWAHRQFTLSALAGHSIVSTVMERRAHFLSKPTRFAVPKSIITFDAGGQRIGGPVVRDNWSTSLRGWSAHHFTCRAGKLTSLFSESGQDGRRFWEWLSNRIAMYQYTWIFSFNTVNCLSLLDFWDLLEFNKWQITDTDPYAVEAAKQAGTKAFSGYAVFENPPTIIVCRPVAGRGIAKFVDIQNYGVRDIEPDGEYGMRDAGVTNFVTHFIAAIVQGGLGGLQATAPSQAMHSYRKIGMEYPIKVHDNGPALRLERESVYSGRNECYRLGKVYGPVHHLDFNSHYPSVAEKLPIPCRLVTCCHIEPSEIMDMMHEGYSITAEVMLETRVPAYPKRLADRTIYPTGRFRTVLPGPELKHALDNNRVASTGLCSVYETSRIFETWVKRMQSLKNNAIARGELALVDTYKRIVNSLFGKFAQWSWQWTDAGEYRHEVAYDLWYGKAPYENQVSSGDVTLARGGSSVLAVGSTAYCRWRAIGWAIQYESARAEHRESCPAITAAVYSAARLRLLAACELCGPGNVYYCDADSIWTNNAGFSCIARAGLFDEAEWGRLKHVGTHPWVIFRGLKHYETPSTQTHSGVPGHAARVGSWVWRYEQAESLMRCLAQQRPPSAISIMRTADYRNIYRHGKVNVNGTVEPLQLYEG